MLQNLKKHAILNWASFVGPNNAKIFEKFITFNLAFHVVEGVENTLKSVFEFYHQKLLHIL